MNPELLEAARSLGETLNQAKAVQAYLQAKSEAEADPECASQEAQMWEIYHALLARQENGEQLTQPEVQEFYALRNQARSHRLVQARDTALAQVKGLFADAGSEITGQLGVDFTSLALAALEQ